MPLQGDPQTSLDSVEYRSVNRLRIARSIDQHAARGVVRRDLPEAVAQPLVESSVQALKSVTDIPSRRCPGETSLRWYIKNDGQVWSEAPESETMKRRKIFKRQSPPITLIGKRRVGEAIGHYPHPFC